MPRRALPKATIPRAKDKFCANLAETGQVTKAAKAGGFNKVTFYAWRKEDPEFDAAWNTALEHAADMLEDVAIGRATVGTLKPVFQGGIKVGSVREYSDTLMCLLLKAHKPEKFRERAQVDMSNKDGSMQMDDQARAARIAQLFAIAAQRKAEPDTEG